MIFASASWDLIIKGKEGLILYFSFTRGSSFKRSDHLNRRGSLKKKYIEGVYLNVFLIKK